jgi:lipopolysaccharide transport system permease protein
LVRRLSVERRLAYVYDVLRELVSRDLKLRYRRSVLGMVWSLLNPLAQLLVFVLIFDRVLRFNIPNYPSFVFVGVLSWNWFQSAWSIATGAITDNRELVKRPGFPMAILPVVTVTAHLIHFVLALPILLLFVLLNGGRLNGAILFLPLVMALQFLLIVGLGYLTAAVHVTFRDTQHLLGVFLMLLFYLTPVFYDSKIIPERFRGIYNLNPMTRLIAAYRTILIQGQVPDLWGLLVLGILLVLLVWLGHAVFKQASYRFVEEL